MARGYRGPERNRRYGVYTGYQGSPGRRRPVRRAFLFLPDADTLRASLPRLIPALLWTVAALLITLLAVRFSMRLLGVRQDIPLPGLIYGITAPLAERFYRLFPVSPRFDYPAVEVASLAAAGVVLGAAVLLYVVWLLARRIVSGGR